MRRTSRYILAVFAVACAASATLATVAAFAAPSAKLVHTIGGATLQSGWAGIWAEGPGDNAPARGRIDAIGHFRAKVTCMAVNGHDGVVTARITHSRDTNYPVGEYIVAEAVDNGGTGDLWRISFQNNGGIQQLGPFCFTPIFRPVAIKAGHVDVH